jgi:hypothetical protein
MGPFRKRLVGATLAGACAAFAHQAAAQIVAPSRPELLSRLVACRAVADSAARLACYDTARTPGLHLPFGLPLRCLAIMPVVSRGPVFEM